MREESFGRGATKPCGEWGGNALKSPRAFGVRFARMTTLTRKTIPPVAQASFKTIIPLLLVAWFQVDSTTLAHKCSFRLCYSCVLNEVSIVLFSAED